MPETRVIRGSAPVAGKSESPKLLRVVEVKDDVATFGLSQSAPMIFVYSAFGSWRFDQGDTDGIVSELRKLADFIDRDVAR